MAYTPTVWKNREVERPRTFQEQKNPDGTVTLIPKEGNVIEAGTPIIADTMNKLEIGIKEAHDGLGEIGDVSIELETHKADYVSHAANGGTTAGTATVYTCNSSPNPTALVDKIGLMITSHVDSGANPTLKWGTLVAKPIKKPNGNAASLKKDGLYTLRYNSVNDSFILQGESEVEIGQQIIIPGTTNKAILQGVHDGTGYVQGSPNLIAANIKKDTNIFGVVGSFNPIAVDPATMPGGAKFNIDPYGSVTNPISFPTFSGDIPYGTTKIVSFTARLSMVVALPIIFTRRQITNIYQSSARITIVDLTTGLEVYNSQPIFKSGGTTIGPIVNLSLMAGRTYEIRVSAEGMSTPANDGVLTGWYVAGLSSLVIYVDTALLKLA